MIYKWAKGPAASMVPVDAQVVGERLEKIRDTKGGRLTPDAVVEDARPKSSPLHECFEWNDSEAAEKFRKSQARTLISSVVIVPEGVKSAEPIRAFVTVHHPNDALQSYTSISVAMDNPLLRAQVLERAHKELLSWQARYAAYTEFAAVHAAIKKTTTVLANTLPKPEKKGALVKAG